jgi:glycosyltransferase involved in cell wall biosynthesis
MTAADTTRGRPLRVTQVSFHCDSQRRDAETLLRVWPTLRGVAAGVARAGVEVTVVQAAAHRQTIDRDGVVFHFVDDARGMPTRLLGRIPVPNRPTRLLERVASLAPDVVHVQGLQYPLAVHQLASAMPGVPMLVQDHASGAPVGWRRAAWRWAFQGISGIAFTARDQATPFFDARTFRDALPVFEVIEGSSFFTPGSQADAQRESGLHGDPCFHWTGHLVPNKDPLAALRAFEIAAARLPDARLWCCYGTAPLLDDVQRAIHASPILRDRVTLLGPKPHAEMETLFRAADFFVQMSHREGSSYSTLEALSCGTTPLVTEIPSMRRIVGDAGSLVPVGDAGAMARAMIDYAGRDRALLRARARERFESALSFDVIGRQLRAAYEALVRSA